MVVYSSPFVPAEWIAAFGLRPSRLMPSAAEASVIGSSAGVCTYTRAFVNSVMSRDDIRAVVMASSCDQMRRASEILERDSRVFLLNVPSTWQGENPRSMYISELKRLGRFLEGVGGSAPSDVYLRRTVDEYDDKRRKLLDIQVSGRAFSEAIAWFQETGFIPESKGHCREDGVRLALIGGPLLKEHLRVFDILEEFGGSVVIDATETGERGLPCRIESAGDVLSSLADAYFLGIPDVFQRPNKRLYEWLRKKVKERRIRAVVLLRHLWCDLWHAEAQIIKEELNLPLLDLDITDDPDDLLLKSGRIQAFMEMLT